MQPGLKDHLFWLTVGHLAVTTLALVAVLAQVDASYLEGTIAHALGLLAKLASDTLVIQCYFRSRAKAKEAAEAEAEPQRPRFSGCNEDWPYGEPPF